MAGPVSTYCSVSESYLRSVIRERNKSDWECRLIQEGLRFSFATIVAVAEGVLSGVDTVQSSLTGMGIIYTEPKAAFKSASATALVALHMIALNYCIPELREDLWDNVRVIEYMHREYIDTTHGYYTFEE